MKAEDTHSSESLWAYLHGELDDAGRKALEQNLLSDPELRRQLDSARSLDRLLRSVMPAQDAREGADEAVAERALAAWERDSAASRLKVSEAPGQFSARSSERTTFSRRSYFAVGLAAAAVLALALSPVMLAPRGLSWADPEFAPLTYRGAGVQPGDRRAGEALAQRCQEALKAAFQRALAERGLTPPPGLSVSLRLQEMREGAFSVCVQARVRRGKSLGEWSGDYSNLSAFLDQADASAARMAEAIVQFSGAEGGGKQP